MKYFILSLILLCVYPSGFSQESANYGAPKFAPEDGKKLLIVGQDLGSVGGLASHFNGYVDKVNTPVPAGVTSYTSIESLSGLTATANWGAGDVRAQAYLEDATFDQSFIVIGLYLVGILEEISAGQHDTNIRTFANWVKGQNRPVFIRIGYEFEGPWNNYAPNAFKNAWRYIVHIFDEEEVKNAAYVWQSAGLNYSNISSWYPGDEYVNWMAYSQFDGQNMGQSIKNFALQKNKPIMIAESAPKVDLKDGNGQGHWSNWYAPLFTEIYNNDRIKALAYINANWEAQPMWAGQGWGDSRIQVDPVVKANWEGEIEKEPWLTATSDLFEKLNYDDWITTNTNEASFSALEELTVFQTQEMLHVERADQGKMSRLTIYDFTGRLMHMNTTHQIQYQVLLNKIQSKQLVITVHSSNRMLTKKVILIE